VEIIGCWNGAVERDEQTKREFFYAFLRNRLPAEASDLPLFMAK
jgi:hypothetical protein